MSERVGERDAVGGFTASTCSARWQQRISVASKLLGDARCIIERARRDLQPQGGAMDGHDDSHFTPGEVC